MTATIDVFLVDELHQAEADIRRSARFLPMYEAQGGSGTVYQQAERFRRRLDRLERGAVSDVLDEWRKVSRTVNTELRRITDLLEAAPDDATSLERARDRLTASRDRLTATVGRYAEQVGSVTVVRQGQAAELAQNANSALIAAQLPAGAAALRTLDAGQVEQLLAQLRSGAFERVTGNMPAEFVRVLERELVDGMALGRSPRHVARRMGTARNVPRWRGLTIARTETLRAYREVSRRQMMANSEVTAGWTWLSQASVDTCGFCWSMHGQHFNASEPMATHPNCKCSQLPRTKSWEELGFDGIEDPKILQVDNGPDLFARQPAHVQRQVLGPAKHQAYQDGQLTLSDLAGFRDDPDWGRVGFERPLRDILPAAQGAT